MKACYAIAVKIFWQPTIKSYKNRAFYFVLRSLWRCGKIPIWDMPWLLWSKDSQRSPIWMSHPVKLRFKMNHLIHWHARESDKSQPGGNRNHVCFVDMTWLMWWQMYSQHLPAPQTHLLLGKLMSVGGSLRWLQSGMDHNRLWSLIVTRLRGGSRLRSSSEWSCWHGLHDSDLGSIMPSNNHHLSGLGFLGNGILPYLLQEEGHGGKAVMLSTLDIIPVDWWVSNSGETKTS